MSLQPINKDHVQQTAQILLAYLDDERNATPNNMLEGIVSGKSLLRGILGGQLILCQEQEPAGDPQKPTKKTAKKTAKKSG